ncbi:unnamed protein product [Somion occarium]|uniref:ARID domain-containing protein n=1 Tax=Somion occarium TaxID=3059160 RepID=A0ABP1E7G9_9APHY
MTSTTGQQTSGATAMTASSGQPQATHPNTQGIPPRANFPPLFANSFSAAYRAYLSKINRSLDDKLPSIDGRPVDLYKLHVEMIKAGGPHYFVETFGRPVDDCWAILAAKLGCVQIPEYENEPARSGPAHAKALERVYKDYLFSFDVGYIRVVLEKRQRATAQSATNASNSQVNESKQGHSTQNTAVDGQSVSTSGGTSSLQATSDIAGTEDKKEAQEPLTLSHLSEDQLKARKVREEMTRKMTAHRSYLQQWAQSQMQFLNETRINHVQAECSSAKPEGTEGPAETKGMSHGYVQNSSKLGSAPVM